ncbi:hypothetical protein BGZ70_007723 [Mortierella alpina]|uniref:Uncharacterized protein n=1 Tax=Mortierella alpina TaxID=64518 RepID=A0A9P6M1Q8_MORAP|nr:hypothetical protein BGZ70_007723 [Mortierella alpina]
MQLRRTGWTSLAVLAALGLAQVQAQQLPSLSSVIPPVETTTSPAITTTATTTTTTTTTTVVPTVDPTTSSAPAPSSAITLPSSAPSVAPTYVPPPPPSSSASLTRTSSSIAPTISGTPPTSTPSNVPVIVGSVVGVVAVVIIVATTVICLRRRKRNNRDLTFDTLEGISTSGNAAHPRNSQRYTANALPLPPTGRASNVNGGYDDGYNEYDMQSELGPAGYGAQAAPHQGYGEQHLGYDAYGTPLQGYQNPSIFQEDSLAYSTGRQRAGYDQTLPEIVYRNGNDINDPAGGATGYYEDDMYNQQAGWNQNMMGGYIGPKGLWVANPTSDSQYQQQQQQQPPLDADIELVQQQQHLPQEPMSYERNSMNQYENMSETVVGSAGSPQSKFLGHNPQALPESPRLQQLRGGDLFGQDGEAAAAASPSPRAAHAQPGSPRNPESVTTSTSPRLASREDMKSFESIRHSPPRPSTEGLQSYANDLTPPRPSTGERPSMDSNPSNLNSNKSLRTLRREDWG